MVSLYPMKATVQATDRKTAKTASVPARPAPDLAAAPGTPVRGRRLQVRKSGVHGKGVFVVQPIRKG